MSGREAPSRRCASGANYPPVRGPSRAVALKLRLGLCPNPTPSLGSCPGPESLALSKEMSERQPQLWRHFLMGKQHICLNESNPFLSHTYFMGFLSV